MSITEMPIPMQKLILFASGHQKPEEYTVTDTDKFLFAELGNSVFRGDVVDGSE